MKKKWMKYMMVFMSLLMLFGIFAGIAMQIKQGL
ncbi:hypothetical protein BACERE00183_04165 [Bacillus cereus]|nr:hypothetical protein BACERE00183_04165 [Bacillus cereus]